MISIEEEPFHVTPYRFPTTGGGAQVGEFSVYSAVAEGVPAELDGLLVLSDLQGVELHNGRRQPSRLIGHAIAEDLYLLSGSEKVPRPEKIGVILAGDLHVDIDLKKRGGKGDVREVWRTFQSYFRWIVGVAGNHDRFGDGLDDLNEFAALDRIHYLDGNAATVGSMLVGGVGGIIGNPRKPFRREEEEYLDLVRSVVRRQPDVVVLHESPAVDEVQYSGSSGLWQCLHDLPPAFVISGHCHWAYPGFWTLENGTQILNVEGRAVLLRHPRRK